MVFPKVGWRIEPDRRERWPLEPRWKCNGGGGEARSPEDTYYAGTRGGSIKNKNSECHFALLATVARRKILKIMQRPPQQDRKALTAPQ